MHFHSTFFEFDMQRTPSCLCWFFGLNYMIQSFLEEYFLYIHIFHKGTTMDIVERDIEVKTY